MTLSVPVLTIDGPSGSGKGTISRAVAQRLGWHYLDSGALYRAIGLAAQQAGLATDDVDGLVGCTLRTDIRFVDGADGEPRVLVDGRDVTDAIRTEAAGSAASTIAAIGPVREALKQRQHAFRQAPGLVADGRDMGTVIFPDAPIKVFMTASAAERAERRHKQLMDKGVSITLGGLLSEIQARDERDFNRTVAPLRPAEGAVRIDTTGVSIDDVVESVLALVNP